MAEWDNNESKTETDKSEFDKNFDAVANDNNEETTDLKEKEGENEMAKDKEQEKIDKEAKKREKEEKKAERQKWEPAYKKWFWKSFWFKLMWGFFLVSWIISVILILWGMVAGFGATTQLGAKPGWVLLAFGVVSLVSILVLILNKKKDLKLWRKGFAKKQYLENDGKFPDAPIEKKAKKNKYAQMDVSDHQ